MPQNFIDAMNIQNNGNLITGAEDSRQAFFNLAKLIGIETTVGQDKPAKKDEAKTRMDRIIDDYEEVV
jgi:hypothetical protein